MESAHNIIKKPVENYNISVNIIRILTILDHSFTCRLCTKTEQMKLK